MVIAVGRFPRLLAIVAAYGGGARRSLRFLAIVYDACRDGARRSLRFLAIVAVGLLRWTARD